MEGYSDLICISAALSKLDRQPSTVEAVCVVSELVRLATYSAIQRRKSVFPCISHGDRCPTIPPTSPTSSPIALIGSHPLAFPEHAVKIPFETSCFRGGTSSELSRFSPALCLECFQILHGYPTCVQLHGSPHIRHCRFLQKLLFAWELKGKSSMDGEIGMFTSCLHAFPEDHPEAHRHSAAIALLELLVFSLLNLETQTTRSLQISAATNNVRMLCTNMHGFVPLADRITYCRSSPLSFCGDVSSGKKAAPTPRWHSCLQ